MSAPHHRPRLSDLFLTRRDFLSRCGIGFGILGLATLCPQVLVAAPAEGVSGNSPLAPRAPHFPAKAKRVIHIFANGGPSHVDTFDPKPSLARLHGQQLPMDNLKTERRTGAAFQSPFKFKKYGQSGIEVSELFPHVGEHIDDIAVIRSMHADVPNHEPSLMLMNCGEARLTRPSFGSWVTYGLGSVNQNLPGFIAMCPGYPIQESQNWQSAFLPGIYQGTYINTKHQDIDKLIEHIENKFVSNEEQRRQLDLLHQLNEQHARRRAQDAQMEARVQSFELAYRMQMDATDAFDIDREPKAIRELYGAGIQARQLLIARRLLERGVRFVQVWHGDGQPWDNHDDIEVNHRKLAKECDQAIGALLADLKQRGMLEDTLVIWGGEFGRTNYSQGKLTATDYGRDHHPRCFTTWMAGGGIKPGLVYGETCEFGYNVVKDPVHVHDFHATLLRLLGIDHERLTFKHQGRAFRLTDVAGRVVEPLLA
jgi:hypothetical protein